MSQWIDGSRTALFVIDVGKGKPLELPIRAQKRILLPMVNYKRWIYPLIRTGGALNSDKMLPGSEITYFASPKQGSWRRIKAEYWSEGDPGYTPEKRGMLKTGGTGTYQMNPDGVTVKSIGATIGYKLAQTKIYPTSGFFIKHVIQKHDLATHGGLAKTVEHLLWHWNTKLAIQNFEHLKEIFVQNVFGRVGKWATDAGWKLPNKKADEIGNRLLQRDYDTTKTDVDSIDKTVKQLLKDIRETLIYKKDIGLFNGNEEKYPFAYGMNLSEGSHILIQAKIARLLPQYVENSKNSFVWGTGIDTSKGTVTSISVDGYTIGLTIVDRMPTREIVTTPASADGKTAEVRTVHEFNWAIIEKGEYGCIGRPTWIRPSYAIDPDVDRVRQISNLITGTGMEEGFANLMPELAFACFSKKVVTASAKLPELKYR